MPGKLSINRWVWPEHLDHGGVPSLRASLFLLLCSPILIGGEHLCMMWNWSFNPIGLTIAAAALFVLNEEQHFIGLSFNSQEFGDF